MVASCCHPDPAAPVCSHESGRGWYRRPLVWVLSGTFLILATSFFVPLLIPFRRHLSDYLRMLAVPLTLGFLAGGLIDHYIPSSYISKWLARPARTTVLAAAGLGLLMSACSHGILAIAMELHKKGASGPAVIAFLLASPWANLPVTILLIGLFHGKGLLIILAALGVAIVTGFVFLGLDRIGWIERNRQTAAIDPAFSVRTDLAARWRRFTFSWSGLGGDARRVLRGSVMLADMVLWWIVLGMVLASLIGAYVPSHIFHDYLGPSLTGLLVTLAAATVIEICSEGSAPLAFELYRQTGAFGNTFVFLAAGVVTDYTEIGLVASNLGWRSALWMVLVAVPQVLLLGWIFNVV